MGSTVTLLVADPQMLLGESLATVLGRRADISIVQEYPTTGGAAVDAILRWKPAVAIVDYRMPDLDGPGVVEQVLRKRPATKMILLSWMHSPQEIERALDAGAVGFFTRAMTIQQVADGVIRAAAGESPVFLKELENLFARLSKRADQTALWLSQLEGLSPRELAVLTLLSLDQPVKQVAMNLKLSVPTVKMHIRNMLRKTGTFTTQEVVSKARASGLLRT